MTRCLLVFCLTSFCAKSSKRMSDATDWKPKRGYKSYCLVLQLWCKHTAAMQTYSCNCTTKLASCVEKTEKRINKNKKYGHRSHPAAFKVDAPMGPIWKSYVTSFSSCVHKVWCPCHPPSRVMTIPYQPISLLELRGKKSRLQHSAKLINPLLLITEQIKVKD